MEMTPAQKRRRYWTDLLAQMKDSTLEMIRRAPDLYGGEGDDESDRYALGEGHSVATVAHTEWARRQFAQNSVEDPLAESQVPYQMAPLPSEPDTDAPVPPEPMPKRRLDGSQAGDRTRAEQWLHYYTKAWAHWYSLARREFTELRRLEGKLVTMRAELHQHHININNSPTYNRMRREYNAQHAKAWRLNGNVIRFRTLSLKASDRFNAVFGQPVAAMLPPHDDTIAELSTTQALYRGVDYLEGNVGSISFIRYADGEEQQDSGQTFICPYCRSKTTSGYAILQCHNFICDNFEGELTSLDEWQRKMGSWDRPGARHTVRQALWIIRDDERNNFIGPLLKRTKVYRLTRDITFREIADYRYEAYVQKHGFIDLDHFKEWFNDGGTWQSWEAHKEILRLSRLGYLESSPSRLRARARLKERLKARDAQKEITQAG